MRSRDDFSLNSSWFVSLWPTQKCEKNPEWYHSCHKSSVRKQWSDIDRWSETNRFEGLEEHHTVVSEILLWVNAASHDGCGSCRRWTQQVLNNSCLYFTIFTNKLTYLQKYRYSYFPDSNQMVWRWGNLRGEKRKKKFGEFKTFRSTKYRKWTKCNHI